MDFNPTTHLNVVALPLPPSRGSEERKVSVTVLGFSFLANSLISEEVSSVAGNIWKSFIHVSRASPAQPGRF